LDIEVRQFKDKLYKGIHCYETILKAKTKDPIRLALYRDHYYVDELTQWNTRSPDLIFDIFDRGEFTPMRVIDMPTQNLERPLFDDLSYSAKYCLQRFKQSDDKVTLDQCIQDNKLIPRFAWRELHNKCLGRCCAIGGSIKTYVKQAIRGGRVIANAAILDDATLLDVSSLYPRAAHDMKLPIGQPKQWHRGVDLSGKFAILTVNITAIDRPRWFYPKLELGWAVYDTVALDSFVKHCGIRYDALSGYYWDCVESEQLKAWIDELYTKKAAASGQLRDVYKLILNSWAGKTLKHGSKTMKVKRFSDEVKAREFASMNQHMLNSIQ
jgi:hypothetical protein